MSKIEFGELGKQIIQEHLNCTVSEYANRCYDHSSNNINTLFLSCFKEELIESGYKNICQKILYQFENSPVFQTAHHLTPTNGPVFSAIDLISLTAMVERYYLVGVFSGIPFSGSAWSGYISYGDLSIEDLVNKKNQYYKKLLREQNDRARDQMGENRIKLVKGEYRDDLVFNSSFGKYDINIFEALNKKILDFIPTINGNTSFTNWHLQSCQKFQSNLFNAKNIVYFDICRLVKNYLIMAVDKKEPILYKLLSSYKDIEINFDPIWFIHRKKDKNKYKIVNVYTKDIDFIKGGFLEELKDKNSCPSTFLIFFVLVFCVNIRCIGSFRQVEYIAQYAEYLKGLFKEGEIFCDDWSKTFIYGKLQKDNKPVYPVDYFIKNQKINIDDYKNKNMSFFWENLI